MQFIRIELNHSSLDASIRILMPDCDRELRVPLRSVGKVIDDLVREFEESKAHGT